MSEKIAPQFTCDTFGTLAPSMSRFFVSTHCAMGLNYFEGAIMSTIESLTGTLLFRKTFFHRFYSTGKLGKLAGSSLLVLVLCKYFTCLAV